MDYDMTIHTNPDAVTWAKFFMETKAKANWSLEDIDESLMTGWFANAMMAMHDYLKPESAPVMLDDGSAFFVASLPDQRT